MAVGEIQRCSQTTLDTGKCTNFGHSIKAAVKSEGISIISLGKMTLGLRVNTEQR